MSIGGIFQIILYFAVLLALVRPLGSYMARVYQGEPGGLRRFLGPVERLIYRLGGVDLEEGDNKLSARIVDASGAVQGRASSVTVSPTRVSDTVLMPAMR